MIIASRFKYSLLFFLLTLSVACQAAPPTLRAKLDSTRVLMGRIVNLRLELEKDANAPGEFPQLKPANPENPIVSLLGDSLELRVNEALVDTVDKNSARIKINVTLPLQAFEPGKYRLPEFLYVSGVDTAKSARLQLDVTAVNVKADAEISPDAPPQEIPVGKIAALLDKLPDAIYYYWWVGLVVIALIVVGIYLWRRYRKEGVVFHKKPEPKPYDVAIKELSALREAKLWENGQEREYFTRLTEILRKYLFGRFGINAMEMTTAQILDTLSRCDNIRDKKDYVRNILNMADFVKFAKVRPLPDDNIGAYTNALRFVEETRPTPEEEAAQTSGTSGKVVNFQNGGKEKNNKKGKKGGRS